MNKKTTIGFNYDRIQIKIELIHSKILWNLISFSDTFSSVLVNRALNPCGSSYSPSHAEDPRTQHSCTDVQQQPDVTSTYFLPWTSPEKAEKFQVPLHLWRSPSSWSHALSSQTSINIFLCWPWLLTYSTQIPPSWQWPRTFDTCLPPMHAGQGCFWVLCFSPGELVKLLSYLFSKLLLDTTLSWNFSSTKILILYFLTAASQIFNTFFIAATHMLKYMPPFLYFGRYYI